MSERSEELLESIGYKLDELVSVCGNSASADGFYEEMKEIKNYLKSIDGRLDDIQSRVNYIETSIT